MNAQPIPALDYAQATAVYRRLCTKARRIFNREDDESHILCSIVQAMSTAWDFSQGFPLSDLKHLNAQDRSDVLTLINYLVSDPYGPVGFDKINRAAFATL